MTFKVVISVPAEEKGKGYLNVHDNGGIVTVEAGESISIEVSSWGLELEHEPDLPRAWSAA